MEEDELKFLQQHRDLFPTQEMYDEFLLVRKMNKEERVKEIARMLSGASLTSASIANAKELLKSKI